MEKRTQWIVLSVIFIGSLGSLPFVLNLINQYNDSDSTNVNQNTNLSTDTTPNGTQTGPSSCDSCGNTYTGISVQTAYEMINNPSSYPNLLILDVRTQDEYNAGHINGSLLIPVSELQTRISELDYAKNSSILVYCRSGSRSATASQILIDNGFQHVYNMLGGYNQWKAAGY
jgi:rhodanese-related sulfurtransferase